MANTYQAIATATVTGSASTISFTNIPQTFTDLLMSLSIRDNSGNQTFIAKVNNDTGSNYSRNWMYKDGSNVIVNKTTGVSNISWYSVGSPDTANTFANVQMYFPSYTSSFYKPIIVDSGASTNGTQALIKIPNFLWLSTSAITSFEIGLSYNLAVNSSATLYGIKNS
jgi:hypothetical protein